MNERIYLDNNATTRPADSVVANMLACLTENWGNPSSKHQPGERARERVEQGRRQVAQLLDCQPAELIFTASATEANHMALLGAVRRAGKPTAHLVISAVEHAGLQKLAMRLASEGVEVDRIPVDADGALDLDAAARLIRADTALVSVMAANNETGVLLPVARIAQLAQARGVPCHIDATQMAGKLPLSFTAFGCDLMTVSAHKLHGPKGIGALVLRKGLAWPALLTGSQERGRRGGTENTAGVAGFGAAASLAHAALVAEAARMGALRDRLERGLAQALPDVYVYGQGQPRLPNTSMLRVGMLPADALLNRLSRLGVDAASGAACAGGGLTPSTVLKAMGAGDQAALSAIRLSLSRETTVEQIDHVIRLLPQAVAALTTQPA